MNNPLLVLPLKDDVVVFPYAFVPLHIDKGPIVDTLETVMNENREVALFVTDSRKNFADHTRNFHDIGTLAHVIKMTREPDGSAKVMVEGISRIRLEKVSQKYPVIISNITRVNEDILIKAGEREGAISENTLELFMEYIMNTSPMFYKGISEDLQNEKNPARISDMMSVYLNLPSNQNLDLLQSNNPYDRLVIIYKYLDEKIQMVHMRDDLKSKLTHKLSKQERKYVLREELKIIQKELEQEEDEEMMADPDLQEINEKIKSSNLPKEVAETAKKEFDRMRKMNPASPEHSLTRDYLDWLTELPWEISSEDKVSLKKAEKILDRDHYGLEKIKERILEFLAVRKLAGAKHAGAILCFVGPPGVGKTSIGKSIAESMNREFVRISLGGMRDEAEIRGHRRTYIGAMPGRIIQRIKRLKVNNPVIMLDEIDKLGDDFRGDPAAALLEVLDPEQNKEFNDHYIDLPFDLSKVFFITTANDLDTIPSPLLDRMEVIEFSGYTEEEKMNIVQKYIIPKQISDHGLTPRKITIGPDSARDIIRYYTRESGLRNLERQIKKICRKVVREIFDKKKTGSTKINPKNLSKYLGVASNPLIIESKVDRPGIAAGLAWTSVGGEMLYIEASKMPGEKGFKMTGQLGDVMKESAEAALSYLRANSEKLKLEKDFWKKYDLHVHVPAGAIPKDGPSAGITMATALVSLLTNKKVRNDIAMTGEITLTGRVLPIGGLKEKALAALRAGISQIIIPKDNEKDLDELPKYLKKDISFIPVETIEEVISHAIGEPDKSPYKKKEI